jgi:hypothetical protein
MAQSALRNISPTWWKDIKPQAPQKPVGQQMSDVLGGMALATAPFPVVGDVAGAVSDAAMYAAYPEERTMLNAGMSLAGLLPFVPGAAGIKTAEKAADALDMSQAARMQRAAEQGFDVDNILYHGTTDDFESFDIDKAGKNDSGWYGKGVYLTPDTDTASAYAQYQEFADRTGAPGANVIPVYARLKNPYYWPENRKAALTTEESQLIRDELMAQGYDGVIVSNKYADPKYQRNYETIAFDPTNIRSRFAAFDPAKRSSANLSAGIVGGAVGLSALRNINQQEEK